VSAARREQLLDLAADLLERDGLEDFGVGTLARAAGIKPPSLYKQFAGLGEIHAALISRGFSAFAAAVAEAGAAAATPRAAVAGFARAYRREALERPQLYRLMTGRALDRDALDDGAEDDAAAGVIALFGESAERHDVARAAWAWAHGLASLEIVGRFPPGADVDAAWQVLVDTLSARLDP
jgi:AcrR family transcriptional regulator